ncbi:MAG TPA: sigma-54 factor interaction domain-containing protein [Thermoanaerobaculia bacterium]|nr:sigma-54 factor interaction domain-containing protein [Thermoanaerobaculia bacterium]
MTTRSRPTTRPLLTDAERDTVEAISRLAFCNPFTPERPRLERQVLGEAFQPSDAVWHAQTEATGANPNVPAIAARAGELAGALRERLESARSAVSPGEERLYRDLVLYLLYSRYQDHFFRGFNRGETGGGSARAGFGFYGDFAADLAHYLDLPALRRPQAEDLLSDPAHLFACFFQIRRAFHFTFRAIVGGSPPAARLREQVWQSVFTHDLRRYLTALFRSLGDITTLVTGPSGTGKELVARAIGYSRHIPFDPAALRFRESWEESFYPLNLSALSPTLLESELFGHRRGAFTGAVADRIGWFEVCPPLGTVFLDEIGEIEPAIQVKLLRVLETRTFQRLGETRARRFQGKVVAATNRDLAREMREGRFRADLYYRLCSDLLVTPSLSERVAAEPEELSNLVLFLSRRTVGEEQKGLAQELAREVEAWIAGHLGSGYPWPGNVRELAQCVNNVLIRGEYRPEGIGAAAAGPRERLAGELVAGELTAEELLSRYCTVVYAKTGSYEEAARRLGLDRRTVRSRVDPALLAELRQS